MDTEMNAQEKKEMKTRDREKEQKMEELKEEEIRGILKKMKNKKAMNIDGIPMEMWKYAESTL